MKHGTREHGMRMTKEEKRRRLQQKRLRQQRKRRQRIAFFALQCVMIGAIAFLVWDIKIQLGKNKEVFAQEAEVMPHKADQSMSAGQNETEGGLCAEGRA